MTQQQRRATRNALARYGQRGYRQTFEGRGCIDRSYCQECQKRK